MLTLYAPAKVNLILEILGKADNYHRLSSILQVVNLCDILYFESGHEICFKCSEPGLEHDNLVTHAAMLLRDATGYSKGARIELVKNIPWGVGLGGGSSDGAAALLGLNTLWKLGLSITDLTRLASKLGSDVPFFIYGGTALVEGVGEKVTQLPSLSPMWFVLLVPPLPRIQNKTERMYAQLSNSNFTKGRFVQAALANLLQGKIDPSFMFNAFEEVVFGNFPGLIDYRRKFEEAGAQEVFLAGSGPCLFTISNEEQRAGELYSRLKGQGLESYVVSNFWDSESENLSPAGNG